MTKTAKGTIHCPAILPVQDAPPGLVAGESRPVSHSGGHSHPIAFTLPFAPGQAASPEACDSRGPMRLR